MTHALRSRWGAVALTLVSLSLVSVSGCAAPGSTFTFVEENDVFSIGKNSDRHYTQGGRASWVFPTESAPELARSLAENTGVLNATTEAMGFAIGHNIYTPTDISRRSLIKKNRPYAGWLYAGVMLGNVERTDEDPTHDRLDSFELDLGIVGPSSLADELQIAVHKFISSPRPHGWRHQLKDEPGVLIRYEQRRRFLAGELGDRVSWDGLYAVGGSLGNVLTQLDGGVQLRLGYNLQRDFGVSTIRRTALEVGGRELDGSFAAYVFGAADGMAVGRNIFLDGNSFRDSHSVDKDYLVGELRAGIGLEWLNWRGSFSQNTRTREFRGQKHAQNYGTFSVQYVFDF